MPNIKMADQPSGGQAIVKLAYGTYTKTDSASSLIIPVSYTGTPLYMFCHETTALTGTARAIAWQAAFNVKYDANFPQSYTKIGIVQSEASGGSHPTPAYNSISISATQITMGHQSSNYPVKPNDYYWEIWGYST